jgi:hypothetical protein
MNKLDEIIEKYKPCINPDEYAKAVALEFAKHILEEAADNAFVRFIDNPKLSNLNHQTEIVDKQSITDTLNKYL